MCKIFLSKKHKKVWGDDLKISLANREVFNKKPILKKLFSSYYREMASFIKSEGPTLELGSGSGFFKEHHPKLITSDILLVPGIDIVCDATSLPFKNQTLQNIVLRGVLHHIHDPMLFFEECDRVLSVGGRIIINDPYISPFSYLINKYIHFEHCDPYSDWKFRKGQPLMDCNLAMATIIFKKRLSDFKKRFPSLNIIHKNYHTFFIYVLTGGFGFPALIPNWSFRIFMGIEKIFKPCSMLL